MAEQVGNLEADIAGQKFKYTGPLNTLFTILAAFGVGLLIYMTYTHANDAKETSKAFVDAIKEQTAAIKEQTAAQREANCLAIFKDPVNCQRLR